MQSIYFYLSALTVVYCYTPTRRDYTQNGGSNGYRTYPNDNVEIQEAQYIDPSQYEQQSTKPVYVPTYNKGYFENPANMYFPPMYSGGQYTQQGTAQDTKYQAQNAQGSNYRAPLQNAGPVYSSHERYHPTTYEEHDDPPMKQQPIPSASQQIPMYAYQGGEPESHEGEVQESASNVDPMVQNFQPGNNLMPYDPSYGYYGGSGIDTNQIHLTEESKQAPVNQGFTYYYLGRKLWYIPLYFSIYFVIYVGALVLKAVARHKILFPQSLQQVAAVATRSLTQDDGNRIINTISQAANKYFM